MIHVKVNYGEWQVFDDFMSAGGYIGVLIANHLGHFIGYDNNPANFRNHVILHGTNLIEVKPIDLNILIYKELEDNPDIWTEPSWWEIGKALDVAENSYLRTSYQNLYSAKEAKQKKLKAVAEILSVLKESKLSMNEFIQLSKEVAV